MNSHAREIIYLWSRDDNLLLCWRAILAQFPNNPKVLLFMKQNFARLADQFADQMWQSLRLSSPMPGTTPQHQIAAFNRQFMRDRCDFIVHHVLGDEAVPIFTVTDGLPTSRFGAAHYAQADTNAILATWNTVATQPVQARDDPAGTGGQLQQTRAAGLSTSSVTRRNRPEVSGRAPYDGGYNPFNGQASEHMATGVTFSDQSMLNTSSHVAALLDDPSIVALNRGAPAYQEVAFGNATPASDERLLSRRIFRSNEEGVENGVPRYEARLYQRNLDRDVDETLRNTGEMSGQARGYDMSSLYCRVAHKQSVRQFYEPNQRPREWLFSTD